MFSTKLITYFVVLVYLIVQTFCYECITPASAFKNILILRNNAIFYPNDGLGNIKLTVGESITLACPHSKINTIGTETADFTCTGNNEYNNNRNLKIGTLTCRDKIHAEEKLQSNCINNKHKLINIGFEVQKFFIPNIEVCWDDDDKRAIYARTILRKELGECDVISDRPEFKAGKYFTETFVPWYTKHGQVYSLCKTYNSIPPEISVFKNLLEIGHLVAKCDLLYDIQQKLTFQFTNTAPQWKSFNGGNWRFLEADLRKFVALEKTDLEIFTGTYGTLKLRNSDFYLYSENSVKKVPVPEFFWKVIIQQKGASRLGVAIIGMNNIFDYNSNNNPCKDISNDIHWLSKIRYHSVQNGYIIACEIDEFKNINGLKNNLPQFPTIAGKLSGSPVTESKNSASRKRKPSGKAR